MYLISAGNLEQFYDDETFKTDIILNADFVHIVV